VATRAPDQTQGAIEGAATLETAMVRLEWFLEIKMGELLGGGRGC